MSLRIVACNVGGQAGVRLQALKQKFGDFDLYALCETQCNYDSSLTLCLPGYKGYHCAHAADGNRGRPSGGISCFIRAGCILDQPDTCVQQHPHQGVLSVEVPSCNLIVFAVYFPPADSACYRNGKADPHCMQKLLDSLACASDRGRRCIVVGDVNVRTGGLDSDVRGYSHLVPPVLAPLFQDNSADVGLQVPVGRSSCDTVVHRTASNFMLGLHAVSCVVLNGRAPGDLGGKVTYSKGTASSVVDYGVVSAALFASVSHFAVADFDPTCSQDHCALTLCLAVPQPVRAQSAGQPQRKTRVYRPVTAAAQAQYVHRLNSHAADFARVRQDLEQGGISLDQALQRITSLLQTCAASPRPAPAQPGAHAAWFDDRCQECCTSFRQAWKAWFDCADSLTVQKQQLHATMLAARREYKQVVRSRKRAYEQQTQMTHIDTYFSDTQRDFWRVFNGGKTVACPITNVATWHQHFSQMYAQPLTPLAPTAEDAATRTALKAAHTVQPDVMHCLLNCVTRQEVAQLLRCMPSGKAADPSGLTCELLKLAAEEIDDSGACACEAVVSCMTAVVTHVMSAVGAGLPVEMRVSNLGPVPKSGQGSDPLNPNMYRGICISSIYSRVVDRFLAGRLDQVLEQQQLRAPTQCGFRRKHGTLDATYILNTLIIQAQHRRGMLWAVFVDFAKAFDLVRRELLIERCQQLGVHGPFLQALVMLYDEVLLRVVVNGQADTDLLHTHRGTKQGSELSPLLFGIFMDWLHELIALQLPGAGPVIGGLNV